MKLKNKVALITGASKGIGEGIAEVFAKEGANLILCARSASTKQIADTLAEKYNIKAIYVNCDVTKKADCQNAVDKGMETFGQIDILVSNAGVCKLGNFLETDDNDRDFHFNVNINGCWNISQAVLPGMVKQKHGAIVIMSSVTGYMVADPGEAAYATSKAALIGLTRALAREFAEDGIRVNAICPGYVDTPMAQSIAVQSDASNPESVKAGIAGATPLKRLAFDQEEVTAASPTYKAQFYRQKQEWDYLIAANRFSSDIFKSCFMYTNGKMLEIGYPRNDLMYADNKDEIAKNLREKLGIPNDKKTILYAPTWRDDEYYGKGQYKFKLKLDLELMKQYLGDKYVVLLRTHHYIADKIDVTGLEDFAFNLSKYDDITEIYLISDICITDYSSVFFDFANLKRPMLFYTYDIDKYRDVLRGFYIDMEKELPGPLVYSTQEVIDTIINIDEMNAKYEERYQQFYDRFCSIDDGLMTDSVRLMMVMLHKELLKRFLNKGIIPLFL